MSPAPRALSVPVVCTPRATPLNVSAGIPASVRVSTARTVSNARRMPLIAWLRAFATRRSRIVGGASTASAWSISSRATRWTRTALMTASMSIEVHSGAPRSARWPPGCPASDCNARPTAVATTATASGSSKVSSVAAIPAS